MKKITIVLVFSLLLVGGGKAQTLKSIELITQAVDKFKAGELENAVELAEDAVNTAEKEVGKNNYVYVFLCNKANFLYLTANKIDKAEKSCFENYERLKLLSSEDNETYYELFAEATSILTFYYKTIGNHSALDTLLEISVNMYSKNTYEKAVAISDLAMHNKIKGNHTKAELLYIEALKIYEKTTGKDISYAITLNNLGQIYFELGFYKKADKYFLEAKQIAEKTDNNYYKVVIPASISVNLASSYVGQKKYKQAEQILLQNLNNMPETITLYLQTLYSLGNLYLSQKKYKPAKDYFKKVIKKHKNKDKIYYATINNLAIIDVVTGKFNKAEQLYLENLKSLEKKYGQNNLSYIRSLGNIADLYVRKKDNQKATLYFSKVIDKIINLLFDNFLFLTEQEKFEYTQQFYNITKGFQNFVKKTHSQNSTITADLFNFLLLRKKIILQNTIKTKQIIENSENEQIKSDYQQLINLKYRIANQKIKPDTLIILNKKVEKLQKDISLQIYEEYPNNSYLNLIDFNKIKSELSDNQVIIEFTRFNNDNNDTTYYCALLVKKHSKYPELIYLCTEKELQNALAKETPHTITAAHVKNIYEKNNKLYKYLFEKIEPHLEGISTVNISPSGLVHNVAFACLKDSNNVYLKDKYQIKYYVSFANLINEKDCFITQNNTNNIALFGDMKYDLNETQIQEIKTENTTRSMDMAFLFDKNKIGLQPLPATKSEVDSIETIFSQKNISCKKYTGTNAIEENFYELNNSQTEVLHIATHGYYFPDNQSATDFNVPMLNTNKIDNSYFKSGLFFSGATNSLNNDKSMTNLADGILSAYEICNLNLSKVKLVVLSACLTGVGDIQQNEGVIGLSRAFKIAGADNLIISLWEVPSRQTAEFMIYFYKNIASGLSVDKAFAKAQKKMSEKYYTNPYYWGGFILLR